MNDILISRYKGRVKRGWNLGQRIRIGDPFVSREEEQQPWYKEGYEAPLIMEWLSHYDEKYTTPENIKTNDFEEVLKYSEDILLNFSKLFGSFLDKKKFYIGINGHALMRCQDYAFIKTYAKNLKKEGCNHLDLGPRLGGAAIYSLKALEANYFGIEAQPHVYKIQRHFFRFLASKFQTTNKSLSSFFDCVDAETFGLTWEEIGKHIKSQDSLGIKLVPSWMFELVPDNSIDLVTATFMLNEMSLAGILWLISNCTRVMRKGSYFYINDNNKQKDEKKLKPFRVSMDYDKFLTKIGFKEVKRMNMINRVNYRGSPRIFIKDSDKTFNYDELVDMHVGKFAVTGHSG
jgi:hypothetical protein|tara:strand:+ start:2139 stop:3176 length:1038 start_codon:yes stop_codon:yes gene_type:complete